MYFVATEAALHRTLSVGLRIFWLLPLPRVLHCHRLLKPPKCPPARRVCYALLSNIREHLHEDLSHLQAELSVELALLLG